MLAVPPPTRFDVHFSLAGFPVRISPWFWAIALLLGTTGGASLASVTAWVLVLLVAILVHELGHAVAGRAFGARQTTIILHGFGGLAVGATGRTWYERIAVFLAGPAAGFMLALVTLIVMLTAPVGEFGALVCMLMLWVCVVWGVVNLLPVYPLDGGQVMMELLGHFRPGKGRGMALIISGIVGILIAIAAVALRQWFVAILFGVMAMQNFALRKYMDRLQDRQERREPWERGDDWWRQ